MTVYVDDNFIIIDSRKEIAVSYLKGWFTIDLVAILDFDLLFSGATKGEGGASVNSMVRIVRVGRMYKLVKLTRLLRVLKVAKKKNNLVKNIQEMLNIGIGFERVIYFVLSFLLILHITTCLWLIVGGLERG